jgi:hypothetical protein
MSPAAVCIFCEDIREEKSGQDSIIGTLPDNLVVAKPPSVTVTPNTKSLLPKIGVYLRLHLDAAQDIPKDVSAKLINTDGQIVTQSTWAQPVVEQAFADSRANQMPLVSLIFKVVAAPFPIGLEGGKITVIAAVDGVERIAGTLNVIVSTA